MEKNLYLVKKISNKGKDPFQYVQMYVDLGYTKLIVSMDKNVIAELLEVSVSTLYAVDVDVPVLVGTFKKAKGDK